MKKIYILTFQNAINYGAILQCFALYSTMNKNKDVEVLNYSSRIISERYKMISLKRNLKENIKSVLLYPNFMKKKKKFKKFEGKYIKLTRKYNKKQIKNKKWNDEDVFLVGSDQVWNFDLIHNDFSYFFDFIDNKTNKRYSYAASTGKNMSESEYNQVEKYFNKFNDISVREKSSQDNLNRLGTNVKRNIDPVYLLTQDEWKKIMSQRIIDRKYVLVYLLQGTDEFMDKIVDFANKTKKEIVIISSGLKRKYNGRYITNCSPSQFLSYIYYADEVFTNSFHGLSFSILFNKNFYFELQKNGSKTNSRLSDLISIFSLEKQDISQYSKIPEKSIIDYDTVNKIIYNERKAGLDYLSKI